eukprot:s2380_g6.t1
MSEVSPTGNKTITRISLWLGLVAILYAGLHREVVNVRTRDVSHLPALPGKFRETRAARMTEVDSAFFVVAIRDWKGTARL